MSELEETPDHLPEDDTSVEKERRRPRGIGTAFLALLSLASVAAAGYLYWRVEGVGGSAGIESRLSEEIVRLERELGDARSTADSRVDEVRADIADVAKTLATHRASLEGLRAALQSAEGRADRSPDPGAWRIAEVEYLLRIANNRLLMERDTRGADQMLAAADEILESLDDYALHDVRAILAEERMALVNANVANTQSVFLTLEAMKDTLAELPLKRPEYFDDSDNASTEASADETEKASGADSDSFGEALEKRLFGLFEFRTRESVAPRPLIRPEEAVYLELNLRLALERAQLAMLRGDQTLFATSLNSVREWLDEYVDPEHAATQRIAQDLDRLAALDIEQPMPDISRSLTRLLEIGDRSAAPEPLDEEGQAE